MNEPVEISDDMSGYVAFPLNCRIGRIRDTAAKLQNTTALQEWEFRVDTHDSLAAQLLKIGMPQQTIEQELISFFSMVDAEFCRKSFPSHLGPGGAA